MSDFSVLVVCVTVLIVVTLHWYRPVRDLGSKKLVPDRIDGANDIVRHLRAAGLGEASVRFNTEEGGWWRADVAVRSRRFLFGYHHGELSCREVDGAEIRLHRAAYQICTPSQCVGMLCAEIATLVGGR